MPTNPQDIGNSTHVKLVSAQEVAEQMQLPIRTVQRLLKAKILPGVRLGRKWWIPESELKSSLSAIISHSTVLKKPLGA
jgi:excisionase family DNA binding protein